MRNMQKRSMQEMLRTRKRTNEGKKKETETIWECQECDKEKEENEKLGEVTTGEAKEEVDKKATDEAKKSDVEKENKEICKYFQQKRCKFGKQCWKDHRIEECKYFKENRCNFGDKCTNIHRKTEEEKEVNKDNEDKTIKRDEDKLQCKECDGKIESPKTIRQHQLSKKHIEGQRKKQDKTNRRVNIEKKMEELQELMNNITREDFLD